MSLARARGRLLLVGRRALFRALTRRAGVGLRLRRSRRALHIRRSLVFGPLRVRHFVRGRSRRFSRAHVLRGLEAGDVLTELLDLHRVLELSRGLLEAEREEGLSPLPVSYTHLRAHETRH